MTEELITKPRLEKTKYCVVVECKDPLYSYSWFMDEEYKHKYKQKAASQQSLLFLKVISLILFDSLLGQ